MADQIEMDTGDERLPDMVAVTTVCKTVVGNVDGLLEWAWQRGRSGTPLHRAMGPSRDRGNVTHRCLDDLHHKREVIPSSLPSEQRATVEGLLDWYRKEQPDIASVEQKVQDRENGVNGRIDCIRRCEGCAVCEAAGRRGVVPVDVKTGDLVVARESDLQVGGGYRHLLKVMRDGVDPLVICGAEVLSISPDGDHKVHQAVSTAEMFGRALAWFRDLTTVPNPYARQQ